MAPGRARPFVSRPTVAAADAKDLAESPWSHANPEAASMPNSRRQQQPSSDPQDSAQAAGLRYVSDATPGIRRRRAGRGFSYVGPDGRTIRDKPTLARIRSLAIPPAYA